MAVSVTHAKVSTVPDSADTDDVRMSDWNDPHVVSGAENAGAAAAAVATHEGLSDPHPTYETSAEAAAKVTTHAGASDPHGDRSFATSAVSTHESDTSSVHGFTDTANVARIAGELSGTGASPTVASSHSGSTHAAVQAAAEATAASAASTHAAASDPHTVYQLESELRFHVTFAKTGAVVTTTDSTALRWYNRSGRTLTFVMVELAAVTAPTGAAILVDVNVDGTTIFSTQSNRPTIAISANEGNTTTFNTTTIADGAHYITVNIDQIGSTVAGSDLTVTVWMKG